MFDNVEELVRGRKLCVVTVDIQNDYYSSESPATQNIDHEFKRGAAHDLSKFLEAARRSATPIIHVKTEEVLKALMPKHSVPAQKI